MYQIKWKIDNNCTEPIHNVFCIILQLFYRYPTENNPNLTAYEHGKTGYPLIDAGMRQLRKEGWIHHIIRNAVSCFLTRGIIYNLIIHF